MSGDLCSTKNIPYAYMAKQEDCGTCLVDSLDKRNIRLQCQPPVRYSPRIVFAAGVFPRRSFPRHPKSHPFLSFRKTSAAVESMDGSGTRSSPKTCEWKYTALRARRMRKYDNLRESGVV